MLQKERESKERKNKKVRERALGMWSAHAHVCTGAQGGDCEGERERGMAGVEREHVMERRKRWMELRGGMVKERIGRGSMFAQDVCAFKSLCVCVCACWPKQE